MTRETVHAVELDSTEDSILVGRAADGDEAAFGVLVRRYAPMMRAYARRILPGTTEVDDVVQESFIVAWEQLPSLDAPERVKSWLMRITARKAIDRNRASRPQVDLASLEIPAAEEASPARQVEARAGIAALRGALRGLPDQQRECWVMREIGGSSYEEIAADLGVSHSTVRGLLARARKDILVQMENWR